MADCVIFNAQQIGLPALTMFNQLGEDQATESIPAILLLEDNQQAWKVAGPHGASTASSCRCR